jgi:hypothetical protein
MQLEEVERMGKKLKSGKDLVVAVGERDAWRLMEHCIMNYLHIAAQLGLDVDGKSVGEALNVFRSIQQVDTSTEAGRKVRELINDAYKEVSRGETNEEKAMHYMRAYGVTF